MRRVLLLALPALLFFAPAVAQPLPGCSPANANERMCQGGNICVCRMTGGLLQGIPQAFRWDCGIQNGGCLPGTVYQQMTTPYGSGGGVAGSMPRTASSAPAARSSVGKAEIAQAQAALTKLGLNPGPADGVAGPKTKAALAQYLAREGLPPSDRITPEIYRRLVP